MEFIGLSSIFKDRPVTSAIPAYFKNTENVNKKVQGVPQSEAATNPWHQEEEKKDKNQCVQNKCEAPIICYKYHIYYDHYI